jgi:hypothetical protein
MTELCFGGGTACSRCPAYMIGIRRYYDQERGSCGELVGMTRVVVDQRLVGFPDDLPMPAGEQWWSWSI